MTTNDLSRVLELTDDDDAALRAFQRFYEPRGAAIIGRALALATEIPAWTPILRALTEDQLAAHGARFAALLRQAIVDHAWDPLLAELRAQGIHFAQAGLGYPAWLEAISVLRDIIREQLVVTAQADLAEAATASRGLDRILDIAIAALGEAYLAAKAQLVVRTEERYRAMFEHSPLPMWMYDRATLRFIAVNEAATRHYGYTRAEFATMTLADIRAEEELAALRQDVRQAHGLVAPRRWRHRKKDGTIIEVEVAANDFVADGHPVRLVLVTDVTDRELAQRRLRHTEEQLHQAQKMEAVGRLAGGVAHDFNNILTVIESYAYLLEDNLPSDDVRQEDAIEIRRAAARGSAITRQLLTLSRHSILSPRPINLDDLVAGYGSMLRRLVGERVTILTHRGGVPQVFADPCRIEQVLMNLAVNARDAMPEGGRLTIETAIADVERGVVARGLEPGRYVVLAVSDTGIGMDQATQARIFDPFFTTKEVGKGTGLGLAIVHGIVSQAGGTVSLYSEPGHGTTFRIYLPVSDQPVEAPAPPPDPAPRRLSGLSCLVVDDHVEVRTVACRILHDAGCRVLDAASLAEALRICADEDEPIDVALVDVVLGDGRGDALVHQLRELRPSMPTILMSGYPAGALGPRGAAPGDLLAKPFSPASLRAAIARAVDAPLDVGAGAPSSPIRDTVRRARVLVADADADQRAAVARRLRDGAFDVVAAGDHAAALAALEAGAVDVVLGDVGLPGPRDLELLRGIRRLDLDVPVILMSQDPAPSVASAAISHGAFDYLVKPLDLDALLRLVQHAARAHALARLRRDALHSTGAPAGAVDRAGLEVRFDDALDQLWLAFQPIFDVRTDARFGVEALVRSRQPAMSSAQALLDAASRLSHLPRLGRKIRALSAAALAAQGNDDALLVNLHPEDLLDPDLADDQAPLTTHASRVILTLTERASFPAAPALAASVARLRTLGFRIALDDIGAGYAGLASYAALMPELVKLDVALVRNVHQSARKQRTIAGLCRLCHETGTLVVGEGVETLDERDCLATLGCDLVQGYLLGRPG